MADNEHPPPGPPPVPGQQAPEPWQGHQQTPGPGPAPGAPAGGSQPVPDQQQSSGQQQPAPGSLGPPAEWQAPGHAGPPALRQPSDPVPMSPAPPPAIDPEQVQQFQQFQQFQELMRQQKEQGFPQGPPPPPGFLQPWGPPPPQRPVWKRALRSIAGKLVTAVIVLIVLIGGGYFAFDYFFGGPPDQPPASEVGGGKAETNLIYETNPRSAVRKIYDDIAQGDATSACGRFTEEARAQFADHFSGLGGSCEQIVEQLNAQVTPGERSEYANPRFPSWVNANPTTDTVDVSSCTLEVAGGPRLGMLTVSKIERSVGGQWIVTRHDTEPENCVGVPSTPPTT
ncbi:MAG: hypothetical protein GEV28_36450 [Actinophytocola sp.]|uniref:hypothetical protein n=1 Tax=Actinophytocola sp. TaxID=1872138 RepID=UPI001322BCEA|nr:hypothetical protein [Actinophytocola sp.]MPZ85580.1 hypothetical protein [Actinophytocola sp.]